MLAKAYDNNFIKPIQLFNHVDLAGWQHIGDGRFIVKNGLLRTEGGMGLLWYSKQKFGNAKLRVVYKTTYADDNSSVFVRIAYPPQDVWDAVDHGHEIQIGDASRAAYDAYHEQGAIYTLSKAMVRAANPPRQWNIYEITLLNNLITVKLNGKLVHRFNPESKLTMRKKWLDSTQGPRPIYGYIGLQNHDHDASHLNSHVYFKEITVTPL